MIIPSSRDITLIKLSHPLPDIRKEAARQIFKQPTQFELTMLQAAFIQETETGVIKWLAYCLGKHGDPSSIPILESKLRNASPEATEWLLVALHLLLWNSAAPEKLLQSSEKAIRLQGLTKVWAKANISIPDSTLKILLADDDPQIRRWALLTGARRQWFSESAKIIPLLRDPDFRVREWAAYSLSRYKSNNTTSTLLLHLHDTHPRVREWVAKSLAIIASPGVEGPLIELLKNDEDHLVRQGILAFFPKHRKGKAIEGALLEILNTEREPLILSEAVQTAAARNYFKSNRQFEEALIANPSIAQSDVVGAEARLALSANLTARQRSAIKTLSGSTTFHSMQILDRSSNVGPNRDAPLTIAVIIALQEEARQFLKVLEIQNPRTHYQPRTGLSAMEISAKPWIRAAPSRLVCAVINDMGPDQAQGYAQWLIQAYEPRILVNIGISASLDDDCGLADVVVARQVDNYMSRAKAVSSGKRGFTFHLSGEPFKPSLPAVRLYGRWSLSEEYAAWILACANDAKEVLSTLALTTHKTDCNKSGLRALISGERSVKLVTGPVASAEIVGAASSFKQYLKSHNRKYLALDTESSGVLAATMFSHMQPLTICIRAISDGGDENKKSLEKISKDAIRGLAMRNATRLFLTTLNNIVTETGVL